MAMATKKKIPSKYKLTVRRMDGEGFSVKKGETITREQYEKLSPRSQRYFKPAR